MTQVQEGDVTLGVVWEAKPEGVLGRYSLVNAGRVPLFVFDRLYQTSPTGSRVQAADLGWRWLEASGVYRVAKFVPELPRGRRVESPDLPYAHLVEPSGRLEGQVILPARLDQWLPFDQPAPLAAVEKISGLVLTLGLAEATADAGAKAIGPADDLVYSVPFGWAITNQKLLSTPVDALAVPMQAAP